MDPILLEAVGRIASQGILGGFVIVLGFALYKKDKALSDQSEKNLNLVIALQERIVTAVTKVTELMEFIEKRDAEREQMQLRQRAEEMREPYNRKR